MNNSVAQFITYTVYTYVKIVDKNSIFSFIKSYIIEVNYNSIMFGRSLQYRTTKHNFAVLFYMIFSYLLLSASVTHVSAKSPFDSGYDHGCDDAQISDPSEQYINQPEKGPSYHTSEFMGGYYAGVDACSGSNYETENEEQSEQQPESYDYGVPSTSNTQGTDFGPICNLLQVALSNSCSDLVNDDGSLTSLGKDTVGCILGGATIGGTAALAIPGIPLSLILQGLDLLSVPAGCGGLVDLNILQSIGDAEGILSQLANLVI